MMYWNLFVFEGGMGLSRFELVYLDDYILESRNLEEILFFFRYWDSSFHLEIKNRSQLEGIMDLE